MHGVFGRTIPPVFRLVGGQESGTPGISLGASQTCCAVQCAASSACTIGGGEGEGGVGAVQSSDVHFFYYSLNLFIYFTS